MPKSRRRQRGRTQRSRKSLDVAVPDRRVIEGWMAGLLPAQASDRADPARRAQSLIYQAWEAGGRRSVDLAFRALEIDPDCTDAFVLLAEACASDVEEAKDLYSQGVAAGERSLGKRTFEEDAGHFWGLLETRPYMRARLGLAQCLWALGDREPAVEHYREMLRLNPNDNQGIRSVLASCLLELGRDDETAQLLRQYEDDSCATWAYSRALLTFRRGGDSAGARKTLEKALASNAHVPAFLLGEKRLPRFPPGLIGMGDENEAVSYAFDNSVVWKKTPGALEWLARVSANPGLTEKGSRGHRLPPATRRRGRPPRAGVQ